MAAYGYEALNSAGKEIKGSVEADNIEAARQALKKQGIQVINIKPQSALTKDINIKVGGYPKPRDMSVFCRQFVSMTKAGVTISEALKMLTEQTENDRLREAAEGVRVSVEKGETLASSLAMYPKIFPSLMVHMVEAGEASGSLDVALERMATQFEKSAMTASMVNKAMIYPIAVCIVALAVVVVMLVVVIPNYATMFDSLGTELPALTKMVQAASNFLITKWFIIVPAVIAIVVLVKMFAETDTGIHFFDKIKLSIPAFKNLEIKTASAQMARTLSTLLAAGVPLVDAVEIVSNVMSNVYFKEALQDCKNEIIIGQPLSRPLEQSGLFPPMVYHMTRIGEETGATEEMLAKQADYYEEEVEAAVASLMAAMEPVIIIVLAAIVLVLVGACLMPMLTMYETLNNM